MKDLTRFRAATLIWHLCSWCTFLNMPTNTFEKFVSSHSLSSSFCESLSTVSLNFYKRSSNFFFAGSLAGRGLGRGTSSEAGEGGSWDLYRGHPFSQGFCTRCLLFFFIPLSHPTLAFLLSCLISAYLRNCICHKNTTL